MFDIYLDICFLTIAFHEGYKVLAAISAVSLLLMTIPKFYALACIFMMICTCARKEDQRRKYAMRAYTFDEFRVHALNVHYVYYEKRKLDIIFGAFKFAIQNLP